jgi:bifunctional non-homologous end joining protein LigD
VTDRTREVAARGGVRDQADEALELHIRGRDVRVTHPRRVVWPLAGTTKGELIDYLLGVAPVLLPAVRRRPTMLWRFPEGVDGPGWFQAQCRSRPAWVPTHPIIGRGGGRLDYCVIEEPATLVWLANLGTIELHPHNWTVDAPDDATGVVFDLDPGPPAGLVEAARVALALRDRLRVDGLDPAVKTSGSLGLHVVAPVVAGTASAAAKAYARRIAEELAADHPDRVIARSDRAARAGLVFIDWIQNDHGRQLIAPYSPRATPVPRVSTPVRWPEVVLAARGRLDRLRPSFREVLERIEWDGDPWSEAAPRPLPPTPEPDA